VSVFGVIVYVDARAASSCPARVPADTGYLRGSFADGAVITAKAPQFVASARDRASGDAADPEGRARWHPKGYGPARRPAAEPYFAKCSAFPPAWLV